MLMCYKKRSAVIRMTSCNCSHSFRYPTCQKRFSGNMASCCQTSVTERDTCMLKVPVLAKKSVEDLCNSFHKHFKVMFMLYSCHEMKCNLRDRC